MRTASHDPHRSRAVIDDVSVGATFKRTVGVRRYLEDFFVGYHTVTRLISVDVSDGRRARARLDFKGDFGHERGFLDVTVNSEGPVEAVDADLD